MSWQFTNNKCILTSFVKKNNEFKNTISDSEFSEKYLKWLYYPIIKICKKKWEKNNINTIVDIHYVINLILLWYYLFFIGKNNVI